MVVDELIATGLVTVLNVDAAVVSEVVIAVGLDAWVCVCETE
jgi:hypothetical protein